MNTSSAIAPLPVSRRRRPLRAEPLVFTLLLTMITLGINLTGQRTPVERAQTPPAPSQIALAR